jgi:hypothetical protein
MAQSASPGRTTPRARFPATPGLTASRVLILTVAAMIEEIYSSSPSRRVVVGMARDSRPVSLL